MDGSWIVALFLQHPTALEPATRRISQSPRTCSRIPSKQKLSAVAINLALGTDPEGQRGQLFNRRKTELEGCSADTHKSAGNFLLNNGFLWFSWVWGWGCGDAEVPALAKVTKQPDTSSAIRSVPAEPHLCMTHRTAHVNCRTAKPKLIVLDGYSESCSMSRPDLL